MNSNSLPRYLDGDSHFVLTAFDLVPLLLLKARWLLGPFELSSLDFMFSFIYAYFKASYIPRIDFWRFSPASRLTSIFLSSTTAVSRSISASLSSKPLSSIKFSCNALYLPSLRFLRLTLMRNFVPYYHSFLCRARIVVYLFRFYLQHHIRKTFFLVWYHIWCSCSQWCILYRGNWCWIQWVIEGMEVGKGIF